MADDEERGVTVHGLFGRVTAKHYAIEGEEARPAVFILGDARGYDSMAYAKLGRELNAVGIDAYLLDYLSENDLLVLTYLSQSESSEAYISENIRRWMSWLVQVEDTAPIVPLHRHQKIGVLGFSLGAQVGFKTSLVRQMGRNERGSSIEKEYGTPATALALVGIDPDIVSDGVVKQGMQVPIHITLGESDSFQSVPKGKVLAEEFAKKPLRRVVNTYPGESQNFFLQEQSLEAEQARKDIVKFFAFHLIAPPQP